MSQSSKLFKRLGSIFIASSLIITPVLANENVTNAEITQNQNSNSENEIDKNIGNIVYNNLEKNDNEELYIIDEDKLSEDLKTLDQNKLTVEEVKENVDNYNATIKGENGEKAKKALLDYNKEVKNNAEENNNSGTQTRDACDVLTGVGAGHTIANQAAMTALGVSGPVGLSVGAGMTAAYAAGSIACNHA